MLPSPSLPIFTEYNLLYQALSQAILHVLPH